tara:strand:+ start:537 stop:719 length:183 start_codon:yes stop_codon:yes gene_type:complete
MLVKFLLRKLHWPPEGVETVLHLELGVKELDEKPLRVAPSFRLDELKGVGSFLFPDAKGM